MEPEKPIHRPRRLRKSAGIRSLVAENVLTADDLAAPLFVEDGYDKQTPIASLPGHFRYSTDRLVEKCKALYQKGIRTVLLFGYIPEPLRDNTGKSATDPQGLLPRAISTVKEAVPDLVVMSDVALDPYSSFGHDGIVIDSQIDNDATLPVLAHMALVHAQAGADFVAPSDMMDGRIGYIRKKLDSNGLYDTGILSYTAKYASCFYGPFREILDSAPQFGDKKTYQMDPANGREAIREAELDDEEGADILMVKPGMPYLDVLYRMRGATRLPLAVYQVSGEYAMINHAAERGVFDLEKAMWESLIGFKRAGADMIFTYFYEKAVDILNSTR